MIRHRLLHDFVSPRQGDKGVHCLLIHVSLLRRLWGRLLLEQSLILPQEQLLPPILPLQGL